VPLQQRTAAGDAQHHGQPPERRIRRLPAARKLAALAGVFYGQIIGHDPVEIIVGDHEVYIDEADELDAIAMGFRAPGGKAAGGAPPDFDSLDESALLDLIQSGAHYYRPALRLLKLWAGQGIAQADAVANLEAAFDQVPPAQRDNKWAKGKTSIAKWAAKVYDNAKQKRDGTLKKLVAFFEDTAPWPGMIRLNRFTDAIMVAEPFPPKPGQAAPTTAVLGNGLRPLNDPIDVLKTLMVVQDLPGFGQVGKNLIRDAFAVVAELHAYHPVTDWLSSLHWDGQGRINRLFLDYFPGELPAETGDQRDEIVAYYEKTAECFIVGAVARIFEPGCKLDTLPVLVGLQGSLKSQGLRGLVPDTAWFTDDLSTALIDRDTKESLVGKWLVELAEFPHVRREVERVKAFFSRQIDRFRKAYDRANRDWPRQCAFIASTNELEFIDVSGNRRFWPIPLRGRVRVEQIACDRDQLWAETMHLYRQGYQWWLSPSLEAIAAGMQRDFLEDDVWDDEIADWIEFSAPRDLQKKLHPFTTKQVLGGLGYALAPKEDDKVHVSGKSEESRAVRCLKKLGYRKDRKLRTVQGRRDRFWTMPE
jgi:predicted P-loop ATPase